MIRRSEAGFMRFLDYSTGRFMKDSENIFVKKVEHKFKDPIGEHFASTGNLSLPIKRIAIDRSCEVS